MATRSVIGIEKDGKIFAAYCHYDGYLDNNGDILYKHYRNSEKILKLISLGDMSTLGENFEPPEGVEHSYAKPAAGVTVYYQRDRKEEGCEFQVYDTRKQMIEDRWDCEYFYLWSNGRWVYSQGRHWLDLGEAIKQIDAEDAA